MELVYGDMFGWLHRRRVIFNFICIYCFACQQTALSSNSYNLCSVGQPPFSAILHRICEVVQPRLEPMDGAECGRVSK
jgi:hypothetical protein